VWNPYSEDDIIIVSVIYTLVMDLWTSVVLLIFFELVEMYCPDRASDNLALSDIFYLT
jgi:hypothetical protein